MDERTLALLSDRLPQAWRMAVALAGDEPRGRAAVREVMGQAQLAAESWDHDEAPGRWFRHHTVLAVRRLPGQGRGEVLVGDGDDAGYRAFVAAVRKLPAQQREAFVLHHGEGLDARQLGIAMDCSVQAAKVHLHGAGEALAPLAGGDLPERVARLREAYGAIEPPANLGVPLRRRARWRRRMTAVALFAGWALLLGLIALAVAAAWAVVPRLEW